MGGILRRTLVVLAAASAVLAQNPAYEFRGDELYVDKPSHWRNWTYQNNMIRELAVPIDTTRLFEFTAAGVKPKYLPGLQNYVLSRKQFVYLEQTVVTEARLQTGFATALSNPSLADNVGDDDPGTYWEPAAADFTTEGMRNWMLEINLGQAVWGDSVVVLFPPVGEGEAVAVPQIPTEVASQSELTPDQQLAVDRFGRRVALEAVVATRTVLGATGDTVVAEGDTLIRAGAQLPRTFAVLRKLNALDIKTVLAQGPVDPGDVPKQFTLFASMGCRAGDVTSKNYYFKNIGRGARAGEQRRFSFALEPLDKADINGDGIADVSGTFIQLLRFIIFDSDLDQLEYLGEGEAGLAAYQGLSAERKGRRAYFRRTAGDYIKQVSQEVYAALPEAEKGPVRYYKRELPRVAEIQIWGTGPNVAYRPDLRAGIAYEDGKSTAFAPLAFDGAYVSQSRWPSDPYKPSLSTNGGAVPGKDQIYGTVWVDLGATYWVNRMVVGSLTSHETSDEGAPYGYWLDGSDGTALQPLNLRTPADLIQIEYGLAWQTLVSDGNVDNHDFRTRLIEDRFNLRKVRFLQLRHYDPRKLYEGQYGRIGYFTEVQLYGHGYPAEVSFDSPPIVLQRDISSDQAGLATKREILSEIVWDAEAIVHSVDPVTKAHVETPAPLLEYPDVKVNIQTRTSDTVDSLVTYYEVTGLGTSRESRREVTAADWQAIVDNWTKYNIFESMPNSRTIRLQTHRTGRDDDGDGRIDEDPVDGVDNDGDNIIDEDGLTGQVGGPTKFNRVTITLVKHVRNQDDDGDGLVDEDAINGADDDGDFLIDEDGIRLSKPRTGYDMVVTPYFAGWSAWSEPYAPSGGQLRAQITSPSPRKYLQFRVSMRSNDPNVTGRLRALRVGLAPPISEAVAGELAIRTAGGRERPPTDLMVVAEDYAAPTGIEALVSQPYSYFIRAAGPDPNVPEVSGGFNEVLLLTPFTATLTGVRQGVVELAEVPAALGDEKVKRAVQSQFVRGWTRERDGVLRAPDGTALDVRAAGDSLLVTFPGSLNQGFTSLRNALLEFQFESQTLRSGAQVLAAVRAAGQATFQRVESEGQDVTELVDSQTSIPQLRQSRQIIQGVTVGSVFTPNGDGVNDRLPVSFSVLYLRDDRPVRISFYDLAGRVVRTAQMLAHSGAVQFEWDGRSDAGTLVAPGIYVCQVTLEADDEDIRIVRLVSVAY